MVLPWLDGSIVLCDRLRLQVAWSPEIGQWVRLGLLLRTRDLDDEQTEVVFDRFQGEGCFQGENCACRPALTAARLAVKHGIHQTMVGEWKKQAMEGLTAMFAGRSAAVKTAKSSETEVERLHAKIGLLEVERNFFVKASGRWCRAEAADDRTDAF
jgi:transposase